MKKKTYYGIMMVAAAMLSATSCTDFADYNEAYNDSNASADKTLWENISGDSDLSQFASLLTKAGYDKVLNSANSYTVWAPVNGTFDVSQYESLDSAQLVQQFVKNHIASYNFVVSGVWSTPKRIHTLNNKSYDFVNNGACTFDGINVTTTNIAGNNGVMHKMSGVAKYYPNIIDFFSDSAKVKSLGIDSVAAYFNKYNETYLDEANSVVGPIVDGKQTYIDSVMVTYNTLANRLRARLSEEDSSYTVLLPTNDVWNAELAEANKAYALKQNIPFRNLVNNNVTDQLYTVSKLNYLKDSLAHEALVRMLVFSNNDTYNVGLLAGRFSETDSLRTPSRNKFSSPAGLLPHVSSKETMSNGMAFIMDSLAFPIWDKYCTEKSFTPSSSNVINVKLGSGSRRSVTFTDSLGNSETMSWYNVLPSGTSSPEMEMVLPNVASGSYNVYIVLAPPYSFSTADIDTLPNKCKVSMYYSLTGDNVKTTTTWRFSSDGVVNPETDKKQADFIIDNSYSRRFDANGKALADTVKVGSITLPVSYTSTGVGPSLNIKVPSMLKSERSKYSREIRLMNVLLRPVSKGDYNATKED